MSDSLYEDNDLLPTERLSLKSVFLRRRFITASNSSSRFDKDRITLYWFGFLNFRGVVDRFSNTWASCSSSGKRALTVESHLRCRTVCNQAGSFGASPSSGISLTCFIQSLSDFMSTTGLLTPAVFCFLRWGISCHCSFNDFTDWTWSASTPVSSAGSVSSKDLTTGFAAVCSSTASGWGIVGGHWGTLGWTSGCSPVLSISSWTWHPPSAAAYISLRLWTSELCEVRLMADA